jgi:hypothetical protein
VDEEARAVRVPSEDLWPVARPISPIVLTALVALVPASFVSGPRRWRDGKDSRDCGNDSPV